MKKINLLGIELMDYSLREALKLSNEYLYNGMLNTICCLSARMLIQAGENPEQKEWLEAMDLTIYGEKDILKATGMDSRNRVREVENDEFIREFLHKLARNKRRVFLLAPSKEEAISFEAWLRTYARDLEIVESYVMDVDDVGHEVLVNEINDVAPHVVISRLPYPSQEKLMFTYRKLINAAIWMALPEHIPLHTHKKNHFLVISNFLYRCVLKKRVDRYRTEQKEN